MRQIVLLLILSSFLGLYSQNELDAFRHSQFGLTGTARSMGLGGAYSAVGADLSSATNNPAGLGVYRSSSFVISPMVSFINTKSEFLGETESESASYFGVPSLGMVFHKQNFYDNGREIVEVSQGLKSYTFAIGYNQIENYQRQASVSGYNTESSITDMFAEQANADGIPYFQLDPASLPGLAFNTFSIDTILGAENIYYPAVNGGEIQQLVELNESGRRNEWFMALAGNLDDFLYFGGSLGIQRINYEQTLFFQEDDINNLHEGLQPDPFFQLETPMNQVRYTETFSTRGFGINGQLGVIVRPADPLRIGLSLKTPTYLSLTDRFTTELAQNYTIDLGTGTGTEELTESTEPAQYRYNLVTPYKITGGLMYLFGKSGFISADVDYTDFSFANLNASDYDFRSENNNIEDLYKQAVNYRVGGELRVNVLRLRAGGAVYGDPLTDLAKEYLDYEDRTKLLNISGARRFFTLGLGVRQPNYFFDVTFINQQQKDKFSPYNAQSTEIFAPTVVNTTTRASVMFTLGFTY